MTHKKIRHIIPTLDENGDLRWLDEEGEEIPKEKIDISVYEIVIKDLLKQLEDLTKKFREKFENK